MSAETGSIPLAIRLLPYHRRITARLERLRAAGVAPVPNTWQIELGVLRMWHRVFFRPGTIGTGTHPVRPTWRAKLLQFRPLRFPFLVKERAIAPLDFSGLASPPERLLKHLLGAHHDGVQFVYDLEILSKEPGWLERVRDAAKAVVDDDSPRSRWLRDLTVYERYHEELLASVERALAGRFDAGERGDDPDISFAAYLRWCARQPETPAETWALWRAGRYTIADGRVDDAQVAA